jgi:[NiFe] hydrogenase assembly HybE family chaperone
MAAPDRIWHECSVCWHVYDADRGDPSRAVAPGTAFADLPDDWRCPECDAQKVKFLRTRAPRAQARAARAQVEVAAPLSVRSPQELAQALEGEMRRKALAGMAALPISNPRLRVEAVGFLAWRQWTLGVLVTPWSMLLVMKPDSAPEGGWADGETVEVFLPSGHYDLMPARFEATGPALILSLFSPMDLFAGPDEAKTAAKAALVELLTPPPAPVVDRRGLFGRAREPAAAGSGAP